MKAVLHAGYDLYLDETRLKLDDELDTRKVGWKTGDYFKAVIVDGRTEFIKLDDLEKFVKGFPRD